MRVRVLCFNNAFLLSTVRRYLNCTSKELAEIFALRGGR